MSSVSVSSVMLCWQLLAEPRPHEDARPLNPCKFGVSGWLSAEVQKRQKLFYIVLDGTNLNQSTVE